MKVYIIGSLRNPNIPDIAEYLRAPGREVFASWFAAGPEADDHWQKYEQGRGLTYREALADHAAQNVYHFDKRHLDSCDVAVLVYPAGKSAHLELGYCAGKGKKTFILLDKEPERWDVMTNFADAVHLYWAGVFAELDYLQEKEEALLNAQATQLTNVAGVIDEAKDKIGQQLARASGIIP